MANEPAKKAIKRGVKKASAKKTTAKKNPPRRFPESLPSQVNRLATFISEEIPGEPSKSEGAIDCAIRLLRKAYVRDPDNSYLLLSVTQDGKVRYSFVETPEIPEGWLRPGEMAFVVEPLTVLGRHMHQISLGPQVY